MGQAKDPRVEFVETRREYNRDLGYTIKMLSKHVIPMIAKRGDDFSVTIKPLASTEEQVLSHKEILRELGEFVNLLAQVKTQDDRDVMPHLPDQQTLAVGLDTSAVYDSLMKVSDNMSEKNEAYMRAYANISIKFDEVTLLLGALEIDPEISAICRDFHGDRFDNDSSYHQIERDWYERLNWSDDKKEEIRVEAREDGKDPDIALEVAEKQAASAIKKQALQRTMIVNMAIIPTQVVVKPPMMFKDAASQAGERAKNAENEENGKLASAQQKGYAKARVASAGVVKGINKAKGLREAEKKLPQYAETFGKILEKYIGPEPKAAKIDLALLVEPQKGIVRRIFKDPLDSNLASEMSKQENAGLKPVYWARMQESLVAKMLPVLENLKLNSSSSTSSHVKELFRIVVDSNSIDEFQAKLDGSNTFRANPSKDAGIESNVKHLDGIVQDAIAYDRTNHKLKSSIFSSIRRCPAVLPQMLYESRHKKTIMALATPRSPVHEASSSTEAATSTTTSGVTTTSTADVPQEYVQSRAVNSALPTREASSASVFTSPPGRAAPSSVVRSASESTALSSQTGAVPQKPRRAPPPLPPPRSADHKEIVVDILKKHPKSCNEIESFARMIATQRDSRDGKKFDTLMKEYSPKLEAIGLDRSDANHLAAWFASGGERGMDPIGDMSDILSEVERTTLAVELPEEPVVIQRPNDPIGTRMQKPDAGGDASATSSSTGVKDPLDKGAEEEYKGPTNTGV